TRHGGGEPCRSTRPFPVSRRTRVPPRLRLLPLLVAVVAAVPAPAGAVTRLGPDLNAAGPPTGDCGASTCAALETGPYAVKIPPDGVLTKLHLRHGQSPS